MQIYFHSLFDHIYQGYQQFWPRVYVWGIKEGHYESLVHDSNAVWVTNSDLLEPCTFSFDWLWLWE